MKIQAFTRSFYIFQFFFDFIFIYAVEKLFMLDRGINMAQIGVLLFLWSVMTILLEVPSGAIADKWSRKKMLVLSGLFFSLCYFIWLFSYSFWMFLLGFLLRTLGGTFASGTLQAYVYDYLKVNKAESRFSKIWGRGNALRTLGIGAAVALGGVMSEISFELAVGLSAVSILIVSMIAMFWPDIPASESTGEINYWKFISDAFGTVVKNKVLLQIMLYSAIVMSLFASLEEFNDIYLAYLGYPKAMIGIVFAIAASVQALASSVAYKFERFSWRIINWSVIVASIILLLAAQVRHPAMAVGILTLGVMLEFVSVLKEDIVQKETKSYQRATVSSVSGLIMNLLPYQLVFGLIAYKYDSLQLVYGIFGIFVLSYYALQYVLGLHAKDIVEK